MKLVLAALLLAAAALPAQAIGRYNSAGMTCSGIQALVKREGAVILRFRSERGIPLSNRYVSSARHCESAKRALPTTVPSRDRRGCPVLYCREQIDDHFN